MSGDPLANVLILNVPRYVRDRTTVAVEVRILGPFEEFFVHWDEGRRKTRPCWNHANCPHCKIDGHDVRRVAYAAAEAYEYDQAGRRTAKLVCLSVPERQIALAKALPIGTVLKLMRTGRGPGERLRFELANKRPDPGPIHGPFCPRAYMTRVWFKGTVPEDFRSVPPERPTEALPNVPLTPPLPFEQTEEAAERFLFEKFRTNTLAGVAAAIREQETAAVPVAEAADDQPKTLFESDRCKNEIAWHDGPMAALMRRKDINDACVRAGLSAFARTYEDELAKLEADYLTTASLLEAAREGAAAILVRETAQRRFHPQAPGVNGPTGPAAPRPGGRPLNQGTLANHTPRAGPGSVAVSWTGIGVMP